MITDLIPPVAWLRDVATAIALQNGIKVTITSGFRSSAKQQQLRSQYEDCLARGETIYSGNPDSRCRYPANRAGDSSHEFGLAWDSSVQEDQWPMWTAIRQLVGFSVPANDRVHAEVPNWRAAAQLLYQWGLVPLPPGGAPQQIALVTPVSPISNAFAPATPATPAAPPAPAPAAAPSNCDQFGRCYPYEFQGYRYRCVGTSPVWAAGVPPAVMATAPGACKYVTL